MNEIEKLRSSLKEAEKEFKEIEQRIRIINGKMGTMRESIKRLELELAESRKNIRVVWDEKPAQKEQPPS